MKPIIKIDIDLLRKTAKISKSITDLVRKMDIKSRGRIIRLCKENAIDISHFNSRWQNGIKLGAAFPLEDYLNNKRTIQSWALKQKLINGKIKEAKCECCNNDKWLEKPIPLTLHHINGNSADNHLNNLNILCYNCHAMTENFAGKKKQQTRLNERALTDKEFLSIIPHVYNRHQALIELRLCGRGQSYTRLNRILRENPHITFKQNGGQDGIRTHKR